MSSSHRSLLAAVSLASVALAGALILTPTNAWAADSNTNGNTNSNTSSNTKSVETPSSSSPSNNAKTENRDESEDTTSSSSKLITHNGGYGAPELKVTGIAGSAGLLMGSQGGWIINHHFVLGGAGYGLVSDVNVERSGPKANIGLGYGGVRPAVILGSQASMIHFTGGLLVGGAGVSAKNESGTTESSAATWVIEPDAGVEATIVKWLRVSIATSYRLVGPAQEANLRSSQLSGPAASVAFKFGTF